MKALRGAELRAGSLLVHNRSTLASSSCRAYVKADEIVRLIPYFPWAGAYSNGHFHRKLTQQTGFSALRTYALSSSRIISFLIFALSLVPVGINAVSARCTTAPASSADDTARTMSYTRFAAHETAVASPAQATDALSALCPRRTSDGKHRDSFLDSDARRGLVHVSRRSRGSRARASAYRSPAPRAPAWDNAR